MLHRRVDGVRDRLLAVRAAVWGACSFGLVFPACGTGNVPEPSADPRDVEVAAVNSRAAGGLALGTGDGGSGVVVAAAAGTQAGDIDLFTGFADKATLERVQRLAPRPEAVGLFGAAIAFSGMSVAISATHEDPFGNAFGYVDVFEPAAAGAAGWVHRETVAAPCVSPASSTGSSELGFGRSIDLTGQDLVVGAGRYAGGFGRAFVFHRDGAGGRFQLTADLQEPNDVRRFDAYFGDTVQIDGDTLIVTRPDTSASTGDGSKSGKVYVYRRVRSGEGTWALEQVLHSPEADGTWDGFGTAAALAGDLVAVRGRDETWIFQRKGAPASSEAPLANSEGATNAKGDAWQPVWRTPVGRGERGSVALGRDFLVIGDPTTAVEEDEAAGAVRVFERVHPDDGGTPTFSAVRTWTEPYPGPNHGFGARVTIRGGRLLVGVSMTAASAAVMPGAYVRDLPQPGDA